MTAAVMTAVPDGDDEAVVDHVLCACGQLAAIVLTTDGAVAWCFVRCPCGCFSPAGGAR